MKLIPILLLAVLPLIVGCAEQHTERPPLASQIGKNCIVYFRKDVMGMAGDNPSSVTAGTWAGGTVSQAGELLEAGADWVVIGYHGRVFHIPQVAIQMIEFGSNINQGSRLSLPPPQLGQKADDHGHGDHVHPASGDHSHSVPAERAQ